MLSLVHQFYAMGSDCAVRLYGGAAKDVERFAAAVEGETRRIEARYSRYRSDSELARINKVAATGGVIDIDAETEGLIAYAKACFAKSDGAFDITSGRLRAVWDFSVARLPDQRSIDAALPFIGLDNLVLANGQLHFRRPGMELDFGGLGKEYAADRAAEVCADLGMRHGFIDLGGDIRVIGPQPDGLPWRIGIRHPRDADRLAAEIALPSGALATSGDYERFIEVDGRRYCHILDPKTGWPAHGLSSVTVISDRCLVAGSLSTAAMLKGHAGAAWLHGLGVRHLVIDEDGNSCGTEPPLTQSG
jgi:thiamine biosynthesis lipoprotein